MIIGPRQPDVLCFGGEDWWYHNRGHIDMQLMRQYAKHGTVLYVNSIVMQKPNLRKGRQFAAKLVRKGKSIFTGMKKTEAGFWVYSPVTLPVHHFPRARRLHETSLRFQVRRAAHSLQMRDPLVWVACPAACDTAIRLNANKLIYQRTDRFEEYPNVDAETIADYDRKLKAAADLTLFVNETLFDEERQQCQSAIYLDHGVDFTRFAGAENDPEIPGDIKNISNPIVGFFGGIDSHTTDMHLVETLIDSLPEMNFVFVGKASIDCAEWLTRKNVWILGQKPYEHIPHYGKCFDVAIMPWRENRWIQACNPIKLKEYLALGKPVVSTPFPELQKYHEVVYASDTAEAFCENIRLALSQDSPQRMAARKDRVKGASWQAKARKVLDSLFEENPSPPEDDSRWLMSTH